MRFSTLLLALIPATALAAPLPAPGTRFDSKNGIERPDLTYGITKHRPPW